MNKSLVAAVFGLVGLLAGVEPALAAGGGDLEHARINVRDTAAIQRGAKLFVNYCLPCHSANYMRYNRLSEDLGLDQNMVLQNFVFTDAQIGDRMTVSMRPKDAQAWLGKAPPDLSVTARSRGADWLYTYMKTFYRDGTGSWNNVVLPNASMPHVLWDLQGIQEPVYVAHGEEQVLDHLKLVEPGLQTPGEYETTVRDLVTFMVYLSEPSQVKRKNIGVWVLLFLVVFAMVAYLLKAEYWRDVH
ncbi:MAG: cytochrome c1 [Xanthomonadales bacterium]|nr:cytochrome c1 [Xanthomonadales bacterium]